MIINDEGNWHYVAVESLSRLLRGITLNNNGDFYCLSCFRSYRTKDWKSFPEKIAKHRPSGYSWVMCCSFDKLKNKQLLQREKPYGNVLWRFKKSSNENN